MILSLEENAEEFDLQDVTQNVITGASHLISKTFVMKSLMPGPSAWFQNSIVSLAMNIKNTSN